MILITDTEWAMVHYDGNNDEPYADLVVNALREKQRRDKGCPCCNGFHPDKLGEKVYAWSVQYYEIGNGSQHYVNAKYCPMCGRKLTED